MHVLVIFLLAVSALAFVLANDIARWTLRPQTPEEQVAAVTAAKTRESQTASDKTGSNVDWPRVMETNATRIGALATMFFLVTIPCPAIQIQHQTSKLLSVTGRYSASIATENGHER
jgi:hypothetical protein